MRRRYKRVKLRYGPILWLLLIFNIAAAIVASPLTAVRRVRVVGAMDWDTARIAKVTQELQGQPCLLVNPSKIESEVLALPDVSSAHLDRNFFGSDLLTVSYRMPVARIFDRDRLALSEDGQLYSSDHIPPGVPTVQLLDQDRVPMLSLAENWQTADIARLAIMARQLDSKTEIRIQLQPGSRVCLNIKAGRVNLGSCHDLDTKLGVLRRQLELDPDCLSKIDALDLTVPSAPAVIPKKAGEHH